MLRTSMKRNAQNNHRLKLITYNLVKKSYSTTSAFQAPSQNAGNAPKLSNKNKRNNNLTQALQNHRERLTQSNGKNAKNRQKNGATKNATQNPWSQIKKGDSKAERRIADALRNNRNGNDNMRNRQNKRGDQKQVKSGGSEGIAKLREAFMKSLSADRERRQANVNQEQKSNPNKNRMSNNQPRGGRFTRENSNSESRLDQLLRMSKEKPRHQQRGGQSFRDRRFQGNDRNNRNNNYQRSNQPSEAQKLQRELMEENNMKQNNGANSGGKVELEIVLPLRPVSILELSTIVRVSKEKIVKVLRKLGERPPREIKYDEYKVDTDLAELIALDLGLDAERQTLEKCSMEAAESRMRRQAQEGGATIEEDDYGSFPSRPPVVCIMGHVDHGKTTLMDRLRQKAAGIVNAKKKKKTSKKKGKKTKGANGVNDDVAGTEAGGITQVVSAFQVELPTTSDEDIAADVSAVTFLDTPGHAAFKAMRMSGSNGADVIVLVIAADDGVSNQTIEIIDMYKSIARAQPGSMSLVVAMTKVDKPGIDIDESIMRIENQLMEHDIYSANMSNSDSEFGGVEIFPVSGITGEGLDDLIEGLILHSEIMDLRACNESRAEGLIIDAKVENGLGVVADCIIRWGKLELGDYVVSNVHGGKVRILNDVNNKSIKMASPSQPVRIVGLKSLPRAGDPIVCVESEEIAKELIDKRTSLASATDSEKSFRADDSNTQLDVVITGGASKKGFMANNVLRRYGLDKNSLNNDEVEVDDTNDDQIRIPVILKADADGTLAAIRDTLLAIEDESTLNLSIDPVEIGIGRVTSSDVNLAIESGAAIFCFNIKGAKDKAAMSLASKNNVEIRSNPVIYRLLDEAKEVFAEYCPAVIVEEVHGEAKVQAVFDINNKQDSERVAGLMVQEGTLHLDKIKTKSGSMNTSYRIKRKKVIIAEGLKAKSLRKVKEEVKTVRRGEECGLNLGDHLDIEAGDVIECYSTEEKRRFV